MRRGATRWARRSAWWASNAPQQQSEDVLLLRDPRWATWPEDQPHPLRALLESAEAEAEAESTRPALRALLGRLGRG